MNRPLSPSRLRKSRKTGPAVLFACGLDEYSLGLLPRRAMAEFKKIRLRDELVLNPYCNVGSAELGNLPYIGDFAAHDDIVWVLDSERNALQPFWLSPELRGRLGGLRPGE